MLFIKKEEIEYKPTLIVQIIILHTKLHVSHCYQIYLVAIQNTTVKILHPMHGMRVFLQSSMTIKTKTRVQGRYTKKSAG